MVYFSNERTRASLELMEGRRGWSRSQRHDVDDLGGKLHFVKFETSKVQDALRFIRDKGLLGNEETAMMHGKARILATGGGAYRFAELFLKDLDVVLEKKDEFDCLVAGCSFLQAAIPDECFTFVKGEATYQKIHRTFSPLLSPFLILSLCLSFEDTLSLPLGKYWIGGEHH